MKIKDLIKSICVNGYIDGLYGKDLSSIENIFGDIDEFKGLNVQVIEDIGVNEKNYRMVTGPNGIQIYTESKIQTVTVKENTFKFNDNVNLFAVFIKNGDLYFRITSDSIKEWINNINK